MSHPDPAAVVLAAGFGTRLQPLTDLLPKALCPVGGRSLVRHALDRAAAALGRAGAHHLAVTAHHHADLLSDALAAADVTISHERRPGLGTAGGVRALQHWLAERPALVINADTYLPEGLGSLLQDWDGERCRLLCVRETTSRRPDFIRPVGTLSLMADESGAMDPAAPVGLRYVGACLLPSAAVAQLPPGPAGLYEVLWRDRLADLDLIVLPTGAVAIDCGTPSDYLRANLHAAARHGGALVDPSARVAPGVRIRGSVVGADAEVDAHLSDCVLWPGARVPAGPPRHRQVVAAHGHRQVTVTVP